MNSDPLRHQHAPAGCRSLPLLARNGQVRGYTLVDENTPDEIVGARWRLLVKHNSCQNAYYVGRTFRPQGRRSRPVLLLLHRAILQPPAYLDVDHVNRDPLDNRRANLRACTPSQNAHNCALRATNQTGYRGVIPCGFGRFAAVITVAGTRIHIGKFDTAAEAALAYNAVAAAHLGAFAYLNQVPEAVA